MDNNSKAFARKLYDAFLSTPVMFGGYDVGEDGTAFQPKREAANVRILYPDRIIFQPPATIVFWPDGDKTVVRCENDAFSEEFGYAMACMRKLYGTRAAFKSILKTAYRPALKKKKTSQKRRLPASSDEDVDSKTVPLDQQLRDLAAD